MHSIVIIYRVRHPPVTRGTWVIPGQVSSQAGAGNQLQQASRYRVLVVAVAHYSVSSMVGTNPSCCLYQLDRTTTRLEQQQWQ